MPKIFLKSNFFKSQKHIENYIEYIAKQGMLFSGLNDVDVNEALFTMRKYQHTICWRHIYSFREEDIHRLEIDRDYMKALIESQKNEIAKALKISPENFILYASYHNVAHHPHLHFVVRSKTSNEGFIVRKKGEDLDEAFKPTREKIKSSLANEIFREDLYHLKVEKSNTRNELNQQLKNLLEIGKNTHYISKELSDKIQKLSEDLSRTSGKKVYGYLPPHLKEQVDDILKLIIETDPAIQKLFSQYRSNQRNLIDDTYAENKDTIAKKMQDWENSFFHPAKGDDTQRQNIIIKTALQQLQNEQYKEKNHYHHKSQEAALRSMLYHIGQSLHEDNRRLSNAPYYSSPKPKKIMTKKIQKEVQVDQINHIEVNSVYTSNVI